MPKLPRNMIRRRGRPGYYYRKVESGRVVQAALGTDFEEAKRTLRELERGELPLQDLSLGEAAKQWLESYVRTARNEEFRHLTSRRVELYLQPAMGHLLVQRVRAEHLRAYRIFLEKQAISLQTVRHLLSDVRTLLGWCADSGLIAHSPFPRKLLPKI